MLRDGGGSGWYSIWSGRKRRKQWIRTQLRCGGGGVHKSRSRKRRKRLKKTRLKDSAWVTWRKLGLEMVLGCTRHVKWEEATVSAFLHNCSSPPRFPPQAGDGGGVRSKHVLFSWSHIEECTHQQDGQNASARFVESCIREWCATRGSWMYCDCRV